jgi:hypothetical protein
MMVVSRKYLASCSDDCLVLIFSLISIEGLQWVPLGEKETILEKWSAFRQVRKTTMKNFLFSGILLAIHASRITQGCGRKNQ